MDHVNKSKIVLYHLVLFLIQIRIAVPGPSEFAIVNNLNVESFPHGHSGKILNQRFLPGSDVYMLHILLTLLALLWLHQVLFLAQECCSYLSSHDLRSLSCILLSSQALEYILVASGDVEENPGPSTAFLEDKELDEVCNHGLDEGALAVIFKAVSPVAARYSMFLCVLGLPEDQLSRIKTECRGHPEKCLREGIISLLRGNYNTDEHGSLTWRRLVEAIADTAGGNNHRLAREIAAEHRESHNCSVNRDRECLKLATTSASPSTRHEQQNRQWEWHFCYIFILIGAIFFIFFIFFMYFPSTNFFIHIHDCHVHIIL